MRRFLRRLSLVLAAFALACALLVVAYYVEEDRRGANAWSVCQHELAARGESLNWEDFIPRPVPDEENFAMAPLFARALAYRVDPATQTLTFGPLDAQDRVLQREIPDGQHRFQMPYHLGNWERGEPADLRPWQAAFRKYPEFPHAAEPQMPAEDVLTALTLYTPQFDGLAEAARRPRTRFPHLWRSAFVWSDPSRMLIQLQNLDKALELRATANVAAGHEPEAARDIALMLRLREASATDNMLIGHMLDLTCSGIVMTPLWEGLAARRWSAAELDGLRTGLAKVDLLSEHVSAVRRERAYFFCHGIDQLRTSFNRQEFAKSLTWPSLHEHPITTVGRIVSVGIALCPQGWFDMSKATGSRYFQQLGIDLVDPAHHRVRIEKTDTTGMMLRKAGLSPSNYLVSMLLPALNGTVYRTAITQARYDQAMIACALEHFFLDHQTYPENLDTLVPGYLDRVPTDVIDGASMRYRRTGDGRYMLYSIGWNARDDGGQVTWQTGPRINDREGDWVWQYEPLQPPDKIQRSK